MYIYVCIHAKIKRVTRARTCLRNYITELYYGIIVRSYSMEYYGIVLRNCPYEEDPQIPGKSPEPLGPPGTPRAHPGTHLGPPGDAPGTPLGTPGTRMDNKNGHVSAYFQRQTAQGTPRQL